ncbi:glutamate-rich WD repeat-containing protein 1 [Diachasma alloeum]|uniref:glutamate-rich WD repeat-containing protein 1 n=1 Tax=Diachasma alloeum TaxID=454923 RepID=UPI000738100B|nr:glutamate-rich WD repeat-containing protein 1 [Diachasma alloeum]XP_015110492.1 glutamate-rich WD repeat-containing protein 1 [Diachasma alloeum]
MDSEEMECQTEEMEQADESEDDSMDEKEEEEEEEEEASDPTNAEASKPEVYLPGRTLEKGEELVVDMSAYRMLHQAQTGAPCLSFDVIRDDLGSSREEYPLSMYLVAGTQAARAHVNSLLVMKMTNLSRTKAKDDDNDDDEDDDDDDDDDDEDKEKTSPQMSVASIKHQGCVNRVRCTQMGETTLVASWSELGKVSIWNLQEQLRAVDSPTGLAVYNKRVERQEKGAEAAFTFKGHLSEGYGIDWCPNEAGTLATGDCRGNIHLWRHVGGSWHVDQRSFNSHAPHSVEDLQWSPNEKSVLASCSVDKSIKIWDTRASPQSACMLTAANAHSADVNVISWNKREPRFLVSGGDDGAVKIWDLRQFGAGTNTAIATFKQHTAPVTTVEWHPDEATVFASGGADDQIAQWDLSVEVDQEGEADKELADLPPQLLFIHQGQSDVKELHWHPQCPGVLISTAHSGFNVFRTISV